MSMILQGVFLGIKTDTIKPREGSPFDVKCAVIQCAVAQGMPGELESVELKFSAANDRDGSFSAFNLLKPGEKVAVPFRVSARASGDRAYISYYCAGSPLTRDKAAANAGQ